MADARPQQIEITVATLNIRNTADRWRERAPLLVEQLRDLKPHLIGLQEVRRTARQGRWITNHLNQDLPGVGQPYELFQTPKTRLMRWREAIATLSRLPIVERDWLDLRGGFRVAQRTRVQLGQDRHLDFFNTHLHHAFGIDALRREQAERILDWMAEPGSIPQVLVGDFNATPDSSAIEAVTMRLRSAYAAIHGREPERTAPTPLVDDDEPGKVLDYIFVNDLVTVVDAWVVFDKAHPDDERLVPSDHYGIAARIRV